MALLDNIKAALGLAWHVNQNAFYAALLPSTDGTAQPNKVVTSDANQNVNLGTGTLTCAQVVESAVDESPIAQQAYTTNTATSSATLTGANITGGSVKTSLNLTGTLAGTANATLPTVAALVTAMEAAGITPQVGSTYELEIMNTSSGDYAWTVVTATGWTLNGTMTIAQNTLRRFIVSFQSPTAATLQSLGEYAITGGI